MKDCYFGWLSVDLGPDKLGFEEAQWIKSEDVNVEHLLYVFTGMPIDANMDNIWVACVNFVNHLYWHKRRLTVLVPKINGLPDNHPSKLDCLLAHGRLLGSVGSYTEQAQLLSYALGLVRERGDDLCVAVILVQLYTTNQMLNLCDSEEAIQQVKEAIDIFKRSSNTEEAYSLMSLGFSLHLNNQLDAAEDAISHVMKILPETGQEFIACQSHHILGTIYYAKGDREKAIHHFEMCLEIASTFNWHDQLFFVHYRLAEVFVEEDKFFDAQAHVEKAKQHATDNHSCGIAMMTQALIWFLQSRLEDARSEILDTIELLEKFESEMLGICRDFLQDIEEAMQA